MEGTIRIARTALTTPHSHLRLGAYYRHILLHLRSRYIATLCMSQSLYGSFHVHPSWLSPRTNHGLIHFFCRRWTGWSVPSPFRVVRRCGLSYLPTAMHSSGSRPFHQAHRRAGSRLFRWYHPITLSHTNAYMAHIIFTLSCRVPEEHRLGSSQTPPAGVRCYFRSYLYFLCVRIAYCSRRGLRYSILHTRGLASWSNLQD